MRWLLTARRSLQHISLTARSAPCRYSQSPSSMKAVSASMWLLTVSAGNFILMLVAETKFFERAGEVRALLGCG